MQKGVEGGDLGSWRRDTGTLVVSVVYQHRHYQTIVILKISLRGQSDSTAGNAFAL